MRPSAQCMVGEQAEEALDEVQPGCVRWGEVQVKSRMFQEPALDLRRLVRREVVQHDVDVEAFRDVRVDLTEEELELVGSVLWEATSKDFASRSVERGEEVGRAMADVVVRSPLR